MDLGAVLLGDVDGGGDVFGDGSDAGGRGGV